MIYITGDCHGDFRDIEYFVQKQQTTREDILIILGDAGINYFVYPKASGYVEDYLCTSLKEKLAQLPLTLFCVHGNHEARPQNFIDYEEQSFHQGTVYVQKRYPNLLFAKDGEVFDFNGKQYLIVGGAYSIDKKERIYQYTRGNIFYLWFPDEQPSAEIKKIVEAKLMSLDWKVDGILSHTCAYSDRPSELFLSHADVSDIDTSTEEWLETIKNRTSYEHWYFGHFHGDKEIDAKTMLLYRSIITLK